MTNDTFITFSSLSNIILYGWILCFHYLVKDQFNFTSYFCCFVSFDHGIAILKELVPFISFLHVAFVSVFVFVDDSEEIVD